MLTYLDVCTGLSAASVAWGPLGWKPWAFSEIEAFPSAVLRHRYPGVPNLGDMTKFKEWPDATVDLLCGGTPCQSFSNAGLRAGLDDPRGQLMLTFGAIAARYRPRWLVWENVPGVLSSNGGADFGALLGLLGFLGYGFAYRVLDAQFVRVDGYGRAVPQRRRRVFVVGCLGDWRRAAAVLLERESLRGDPAPRRRSKEDLAGRIAGGARARGGYSSDDIPHAVGALTAGCGPNGHGGSGLATDKGAEASHILAVSRTLAASQGGIDREDRHTLLAFGGNNTSGPIDVSTALLAQPGSGWKGDFESETFIAQPAIAFHGSQDPDVSGDVTHPVGRNQGQETCAQVGTQVRRLMPIECERLQGFPDGYTAIPWRRKPASKCPDGPRYKALGNSWAVNCPRWIGRRINMVEGIA